MMKTFCHLLAVDNSNFTRTHHTIHLECTEILREDLEYGFAIFSYAASFNNSLNSLQFTQIQSNVIHLPEDHDACLHHTPGQALLLLHELGHDGLLHFRKGEGGE